MRPLLHRAWFFIFVALACCAATARAQTLAFSPHLDGLGHDDNGGLQDFNSSLGLLFDLSGSLTVSSVGYWDDNRDGIANAGAITVAIFDRNASGGPAIVSGTQKTFTGNDGVLVGGIVTDELTSAATPVATGREGQFRLANLSSPIVLPAGNYALVAWGYDGSNEFLNGANTGRVADETSFGVLSFVRSAFDDMNPLVPGSYPNTLDASFPQYTAATFSPTAIPEPAAVAIILGGSSLLIALVVRRRGSLRLVGRSDGE